jgi:hypothetical protein
MQRAPIELKKIPGFVAELGFGVGVAAMDPGLLDVGGAVVVVPGVRSVGEDTGGNVGF